METNAKALAIFEERFGKDSLVSLATCRGNGPSVRTINAYYEDGCFYCITYALSHKMKEIEANPQVAICGEWMQAHGIGENLGYLCSAENAPMAAKLRSAFAAWYSNGHTDESDPNTILLRVRLQDAVLWSNGTRYELVFPQN